MKKLIVGLAVLAVVSACNQPAKTEEPSSPANASASDNETKALFEKNLGMLKDGISAFEKEDLNGWAATVADSAKWLSPAYGAVKGNKEDWKKALGGFTADWDSIKLVNPSFLPGIDSVTQQFDGSVRYYGEWQAVHKSGIRTRVNYYGTYDFNKDNKVVDASEFYDLGGLMNAVKGKK